jgi:hypothetical protein
VGHDEALQMEYFGQQELVTCCIRNSLISILPEQHIPVSFIISSSVCFQAIFESTLRERKITLTTRLNCGVLRA